MRTEMLAPETKEQTDLYRSVRRSFYAECSGDVMVVTKPYYQFAPLNLSQNPDKSPSYRTGHGTPHAYDTHVPLLVMGPGIQAGCARSGLRRKRWRAFWREALGVPRPASASYPLPAGLFKR